MPVTPLALSLLLTASQPVKPDSLNVPERFRGEVVVARPKGFPEKIIALTFDDGPDPKVTGRILDTLRAHGAKATFFVLGANAQHYEETMLRIAREGHAIGQHTWSHPAKANRAKAEKEFEKVNALIKRQLGFTPILYRPPYGITRNAMTPLAKERKDVVVIWTATSADTATKNVNKIYRNVAYTPNPGEIILLHDGYGRTWTADALPKILTTLKKKGFRFVTVPELLRRYDAYLTKHPDRKGVRTWGI